MGKAIDITGQRYGRLTVLSQAASDYCGEKSVAKWHCLCDCGKAVEVASRSLRGGNTKSCGCLRKEVAQSNGRKLRLERQLKRANKLKEELSLLSSEVGDIGMKATSDWIKEAAVDASVTVISIEIAIRSIK